MNIENILSQRRATILNKWIDLILETYPVEAAEFFKRKKDRFANPVGYTIFHEIEALYEELLRGATESDKVSQLLDRIVKIRAVQDFSPSQAIGFVFLLKKVIRKELEDEILEEKIAEDLLEFESRLDELALLSFDIYMKCREKIYEIKTNEVKKQLFRLLERSGMVYKIPDPDQEPDIKETGVDNIT
nr:hypothetical protein [Desulfobacterales bacterium]